MRSWKRTTLAAAFAALLVFVVASMSSLQAADQASTNVAAPAITPPAPILEPAPAAVPRAAVPAGLPLDPADKRLAVGGGLLLLALAALGLTITFRSLLGDIRGRRNRYRRRAKREPRSA